MVNNKVTLVMFRTEKYDLNIAITKGHFRSNDIITIGMNGH